MDSLQEFFESTIGQVSTVVIIALILLLIMRGTKESRKKIDTRALSISALTIALSIVLGMIKLFQMPQGGSITLMSMLPIAVCGYFLGTRRAVMAGICVGLVNLILGPYIVHPAQLLIDYPLAFGAMGLSGLMKDKKHGLFLGYLIALLARYACAVLSGIIFFGEYAQEGFTAITWSLWYNLTYLGVEGLITAVIILIPKVESLFERLKTNIDVE